MLSALKASLSLVECNHRQVQKTAMTSGTCKEKLEMHIFPPICALICIEFKE